jgi:mannose-6-phosphate isomerase-like protein (cupin superfamily)
LYGVNEYLMILHEVEKDRLVRRAREADIGARAWMEESVAMREEVRGKVIENPVIGDRVTFLKSAEETEGEYLLLKVELAPHGGNAMHYHLTFTEAFEVLEGRLNIDLGGRHLVLGPGEKALVPIKAHHRFYSTSDEPVTFTVEIRSARRMEEALRVAYGLARDGKTNAKSVPRNIFQLALLYQLGESYLAGMPLFLQRAVFGALAKVARWRGVEKSFEKYL